MARPRVLSFSVEEMIELGKEMVEWVIENDPIHLSQWYTIHKGYTYNEWKNFIVKEEFFPYYEKALKIVGIKYLDGESKRIKDGISQRWQRVYFGDLRDQEDVDADADAKRAALAKITDQTTPEIKEQLENLFNLMRNAQTDSSSNKDKINLSKEQ